ncbi:glycoside hydrolase family 18 protein [Bacillus horti]|uniref:Spore germination protein n=1 Tax=Caldalkalibacillus horti TaxID=77523 RepID=A0ABT9W4K7_9BACI|nr:glycoside hydrolase family 18 protein [Bacillus horti]MDQ0168173.1 spore germination protein [Bacillus horti]
MQIHVVKQGETLQGIANTYNVTAARLEESNQIPNADRLVPGQTIVIPIWGSYHWIQPGESLYQLSRRYEIPVEELQRINQISSPEQLQVGFRVYIPQKQRPERDVSAYLEPRPTGNQEPAIINSVGENLTFITLFSYQINADGTLRPMNDQPSINAAYQNRVVPLMVLTNIPPEGGFSTELITTILNDPALQDRLLDESLAIMREKGYLGLDFDIEYVGAANREKYNELLRKASARLKAEGFLLSSALAPKTSVTQTGVLYEGHDYQAHGEIVDFTFIMTYEWGWSGGPPMAVSPLNQVRRVMEFAVSQIPTSKLMMGIPLYGYDWTLPYVQGGAFARAISPQQAILLADQYGVEIQYDETAQSPHFNYTDEQGREHEVWFEDARSIQAKFDLVKELGIRGFFYWVLRFEFPQNWLLVQDNFVVRKRV